MSDTIGFKSSSHEYGYMANFYRKIFVAEGIKWKTAEHYYQYKKVKYLQSIGEPIPDERVQAIIDAKTPMILRTAMLNAIT
jgi:predicted NAD-dependent protein-ADP-ribosyltransferase YbiA (DUF1768 family)